MGLSIDDFKNVFKTVLGIEKADRQIERLFMKIDTSSDGYIDWDEFWLGFEDLTPMHYLLRTMMRRILESLKTHNCSYMQLEYAEKEAVYRRGMQIDFSLPVVFIQ